MANLFSFLGNIVVPITAHKRRFCMRATAQYESITSEVGYVSLAQALSTPHKDKSVVLLIILPLGILSRTAAG